MSDKTKKMIAKMLCENTGTSILDSGGTPKYDENGKYVGSTGGYGRAYERNSLRDFESEQPVSLKFSTYRNKEVCVEITANLYHWLSERVEYDEETDKLFQGWMNKPYNEDESYSDLIDRFPYVLAKLKGLRKRDVSGGPYGEGKPTSFYTYNSENVLSQDIIVSDFVLDGEPYVMLQIHNGCDARGGFTRPRIFQPNEPESLYMYADASIGCENGHGWFTDDSYHWYPSNNEGKLKEYRVITDEEIADNEEYQNALRQVEEAKAFKAGIQPLMEGFPAPDPKIGLLRIDDDGNGYCPICGELLTGWA